MKKSLALLLVLVAFATGACSNTLNGVVTSKDVEAGYVWTTFVLTGKVMIPVTYYVPPCYELTIDGDSDDASGTTCVSKGEWERTDIGDTYVGDDVDPKDRKEKA